MINSLMRIVGIQVGLILLAVMLDFLLFTGAESLVADIFPNIYIGLPLAAIQILLVIYSYVIVFKQKNVNSLRLLQYFFLSTILWFLLFVIYVFFCYYYQVNLMGRTI